MAASRADGPTRTTLGERGVLAGRLPEPSREPDFKEQSSVERTDKTIDPEGWAVLGGGRDLQLRQQRRPCLHLKLS